MSLVSCWILARWWLAVIMPRRLRRAPARCAVFQLSSALQSAASWERLLKLPPACGPWLYRQALPWSPSGWVQQTGAAPFRRLLPVTSASAASMRHRPNSTRRRRSRTQPRSPVYKEATMTPSTQILSGLSSSKSAPVDRAKQLAATLLSQRGEASGAQVARELHQMLRALDADDRHSFQRYLATEFQPEKAALCP